MRRTIIKSYKGAISIIAIILLLFVIAAAGVTVYFVAGGSASSSHAELIPENTFLLYTAIEDKELSQKMYDAMGTTKDEQMKEATNSLQMLGAFIDVEKTEKLLKSITNMNEAVGRVTFACSNLDLSIKNKMVEMPDDWGYGRFNGNEYKNSIKAEDFVNPPQLPPPPIQEDNGIEDDDTPESDEGPSSKPYALPDPPKKGSRFYPKGQPEPEKRYYEKSEVKLGLDAMIIFEIIDVDKIKEIGKKLDFDLDNADSSEYQGVEYYEVKALNFDDFLQKNEDFELINGGKIFACIFGSNLVVANGEANIKNIIDVQAGNAKSIKDNDIASKRIDWNDDMTCCWININYLTNYFASMGDKNSDFKDFQEIHKALNLSDIESFVASGRSDLSDRFTFKYFVNPENKYLKMLNEIPPVDTEQLFTDLPKNAHLSATFSLKNGVSTFEDILKEMRSDLPKSMTDNIPEDLERNGFPQNTLHLLQYASLIMNFDNGIYSPIVTSIYKLADDGDEKQFESLKKSDEFSDYIDGYFENGAYYSTEGSIELAALKSRMNTQKMNSAIKKLDEKYHLICIIPNPKNLFKLLNGETTEIDFDAMTKREDFYVLGFSVEKDGVKFSMDPMFDLAVEISKFSKKMQESMGMPNQQYNNIIRDAQWAEAKIAVGSLRAALDTYNAKTGGDLSKLKEYIDDGFTKGSRLLLELRFDDEALSDLQYFDPEDFSLELKTEGEIDDYIITVDASKGVGGATHQGPKTGVGKYSSETESWTGMLGDKINSFNSSDFMNPPQLPPPPIQEDNGIKEASQWDEAKKAVKSLKVVIDTYKAMKKGDISGLKEYLSEGFSVESKLIKELRFDPGAFTELKYFDHENFILELLTDGKDGEYIIKVVAYKGGGTSFNGPEGIGKYSSKTNEWSGMFE